MVDSVHGIICMYNKTTRDIALWNPATRQCRLLPKSLDGYPKDGYEHHDFVGLGFDVKTKDYKVIQVSSLEAPLANNGLRSRLNVLRKVQIYSLCSDSWRLIDSDFRTHCCGPIFGRSLNGIYFHLGLTYPAEPDYKYLPGCEKSVILSFDLSKESYQRVVQLPEDFFIQLGSIGDKLACITDFRECSGLYKVWMLNHYNTEKESWTELYRVGTRNPELQTRLGYLHMLTILRNGKFCLFGGETSLVLYNSVTDEFEGLGLGEERNTFAFNANIYKESLVCVDANGSATKAISI